VIRGIAALPSWVLDGLASARRLPPRLLSGARALSGPVLPVTIFDEMERLMKTSMKPWRMAILASLLSLG
jgi:hypothetical protein